MSKVLIAKLVKPISGYQSDKDKIAESGMEIGTEVKVDKVSMGQSHTYIFLEGFSGSFNSVHFEFLIDGKPHDIYGDPDYNPYIKGLANGQD